MLNTIIMKKGILLIATGHPYYGRMAYNLALTIKAAEQDMPIALVHDAGAIAHLTKEQQDIFDKLVTAPSLKSRGMEAAMELRLLMPKLTPFEETLSLDVDMAWLPEVKVSPLFELLSERDITYVNEGYYDLDASASHYTNGYTGWAQPEDIKAAYELQGKLYAMRGEFILFKKNAAVAKVFANAARIRKKPLLQPQTLGGAVTEEFALNIALNGAGLEPHQTGWQPTYWPLMHGNAMPPIAALRDEGYYALSVGGNTIGADVKRAYEFILKAACGEGVKGFPLGMKRHWATERRVV